MADYTPKEPPSTEKSLNQISWHLKTLVEEMKGLSLILKQMNSQKKFSKMDDEISF